MSKTKKKDRTRSGGADVVPVDDILPQPSRLIGPEDVRVGAFVTVSEQTFQMIAPPDGCGVSPTLHHITGVPWNAGTAYKVVGVCLPFVATIDRDGDAETFDLRRHRLALLSDSFGRQVFKKKEKTRK